MCYPHSGDFVDFDEYFVQSPEEHSQSGPEWFERPLGAGHQDGHVNLKSAAGHGVGVVGGYFEQRVGYVGQTLWAQGIR